VAGDALDFGVVKTVDDDLVIRPQQSKLCVDGAGRAALGPADDPQAEEDHNQNSSDPKNKPESFHDVLALFSKGSSALTEIISAGIVRPASST
jgi:hypothetical protein